MLISILPFHKVINILFYQQPIYPAKASINHPQFLDSELPEDSNQFPIADIPSLEEDFDSGDEMFSANVNTMDEIVQRGYPKMKRHKFLTYYLYNSRKRPYRLDGDSYYSRLRLFFSIKFIGYDKHFLLRELAKRFDQLYSVSEERFRSKRDLFTYFLYYLARKFKRFKRIKYMSEEYEGVSFHEELSFYARLRFSKPLIKSIRVGSERLKRITSPEIRLGYFLSFSYVISSLFASLETQKQLAFSLLHNLKLNIRFLFPSFFKESESKHGFRLNVLIRYFRLFRILRRNLFKNLKDFVYFFRHKLLIKCFVLKYSIVLFTGFKYHPRNVYLQLHSEEYLACIHQRYYELIEKWLNGKYVRKTRHNLHNVVHFFEELKKNPLINSFLPDKIPEGVCIAFFKISKSKKRTMLELFEHWEWLSSRNWTHEKFERIYKYMERKKKKDLYSKLDLDYIKLTKKERANIKNNIIFEKIKRKKMRKLVLKIIFKEKNEKKHRGWIT